MEDSRPLPQFPDISKLLRILDDPKLGEHVPLTESVPFLTTLVGLVSPAHPGRVGSTGSPWLGWGCSDLLLP